MSAWGRAVAMLAALLMLAGCVPLAVGAAAGAGAATAARKQRERRADEPLPPPLSGDEPAAPHAPETARERTLTLPGKLLLVVTEGVGEARSIGSYTARLYRADDPATPRGVFLGGSTGARDGVIEELRAVPAAGAESKVRAVVVMRSAGVGGYLGVDLLALGGNGVTVERQLRGLAPDTDPVAAALTGGDR
ncbi:MAG: PliI family lysozyme inhibitor of I-type lysozyme [Sphingomonadaceae bacterium]|nr:PliI family lysozyme inhibitor of I-type lysozyme [Sphingomonadaceae bacterium]